MSTKTASGGKPKKSKTKPSSDTGVKKKSKASKSSKDKTQAATTISCKDLIYLDNNATTLICKDARETMTAWQECYNPSSDSKVSKSAREMIKKARSYILRHCGVNEESHYVVFTSGATESNCMIVRSTAEAFKKERGVIPHIIVSSIEHHSILECLHIMKENDLCEYTEIAPTPEGTIKPRYVEQAIQPNTCLISIMYMNNEIGSINNIKAIGEIAHRKGVPMHTDAVQLFGKMRILMEATNVDAISACAHKWYGPKSQGVLVISKALVEGYHLHSQIAGSQQDGLRGGTENVPGIASMLSALQWTFRHRDKKNKNLLAMRNYVIEALSKEWNRMYYRDFLTVCELKEPFKSIIYDQDPVVKQQQVVVGSGEDQSFEDQTLGENPVDDEPLPDAEAEEEKKELAEVHLHQKLKGTRKRPMPIFVVLGPNDDELTRHSPNTLFIAFINPLELPAYGSFPGIEPFCNVKLKHELDKMNVVVSIASACLTSSDKASHVLKAIGAPSFIKRGVIRVSFGDTNTMYEVKEFLKRLKNCVYKQI